jgi:hypothetical protein
MPPYRELAGLAHFHEWAAKMKAEIDKKNLAILEQKQKLLDDRTEIGVGDFVIDGDKLLRVAQVWDDDIQLTDGRYGASFYLSNGSVSMSGGLDPAIDKTRFLPTDDKRDGSCWFFSENYVRGHNGYETTAKFRVWRLVDIENK